MVRPRQLTRRHVHTRHAHGAVGIDAVHHLAARLNADADATSDLATHMHQMPHCRPQHVRTEPACEEVTHVSVINALSASRQRIQRASYVAREGEGTS